MGSQRFERFTMITAGYLVKGLTCDKCLFLPPRGAEVDPRGGGASTQKGDTGPDRQRMLSFVGGVRS